MSHLQSLVARWQRADDRLLPPVPAEAVMAAFTRVGSRATRDVIELYAAIGGMESFDDEMFLVWPLAEIVSGNDERSEFGPIFADFMLNAWCYRLRPVNDVTSAVYADYFDQSPPRLIFESLTELIAIHDRDAKSIHKW